MLRVFEAFSGIGSQRQALKNCGVEHEIVAVSEIDKFAFSSYEAIHGKTRNLGDISKIDLNDIPSHDLFTYSFPCQDISIAGMQKGLSKGSKTRSSLLWECQRVIEAKKPKYLLMENVKNLVSITHVNNFIKWLNYLGGLGYTNSWALMNAKDYGTPQNRERVFLVSILNDREKFYFPNPKGCNPITDYLETNVNHQFYLSQDKVNQLLFKGGDENKLIWDQSQQYRNKVRGYNETAMTLTARDYKDPRLVNESLLIKNATKKGFIEANVNDCVDLFYPNSKTRSGRVQKQLVQTLTCGDTIGSVTNELKIRKLTPKEYWLLTGFSLDEFEKAQKVNSNTQLYKQAGNSIVVTVLEAIFSELFK